MNSVIELLENGTPKQIKALFQFDTNDSPETIVTKYKYWSRYFFPKMFKDKEAPFHHDMAIRRARLYLGLDNAFLNIAYRGSGKTTDAKVFRAFAIANDKSHSRKYMRVLSKDINNATQSVTDIYNMLISSRRSPIGNANLSMRMLYPEIFAKTDTKREETMSSFTTTTGIKVIAKSILPDQRGNVQGDEESSRPDFDLYDDFETRTTLMSAVITNRIWQNMEEARTGLAKNGGSEYTCNYVSEQGNVDKLVRIIDNKLIIPIEENGVPTWDRYSMEEIMEIKRVTDDYEGEYLCKPTASKDLYFDRASLEQMSKLQPIRDIAGFKMFKEYNPAHRYAGGHDVAGGVGLDSSASVFIDFSTIPAQVVGTFSSNTILPEAFGDEIYAQANRFGGCLVAPENNKFDQATLKAKLLGANVYAMQGRAIKTGLVKPTVYGWETNGLTKSTMLSDLREAIESGHIQLNDPDLIEEAMRYTRNDLIDRAPDIRLTTRHFDLLMAACIAWQMRDIARPKKKPRVVISGSETESNPAI